MVRKTGRGIVRGPHNEKAQPKDSILAFMRRKAFMARDNVEGSTRTRGTSLMKGSRRTVYDTMRYTSAGKQHGTSKGQKAEVFRRIIRWYIDIDVHTQREEPRWISILAAERHNAFDCRGTRKKSWN